MKNNGPGLAEPVERFGLNNLSFAGPVIMGVGGKLYYNMLQHSRPHHSPGLPYQTIVVGDVYNTLGMVSFSLHATSYPDTRPYQINVPVR